MNLIYSIAYGFHCNHRAPLMVKSMRELGEFKGEIMIFSDQPDPIPGATVVFRPELGETDAIMSVRWQIGKYIELDDFRYMAMIDTDVVAIKPINVLFDGNPAVVRVPKEYPDGRETNGNTPWSLEGVPMDSSKPFHNCGTVFGHASSWHQFSGLMCRLMLEFKPRIAPHYPWIDQQILNHIERHDLFPVETLPDEWVFLCRRNMGVSMQTKLVHCIPGGNEKVQLMHLAYTLAKRIRPEE